MSCHNSGPDFGFPHSEALLDLTDLYALPKPSEVDKSILIMNVHPSAVVNPPGSTTCEPFAPAAHTTGGRAGMSRSSDGRLEVRLSRPGGPGHGTNSEQLFAAGWSACFESAIEFAARNMKITLPADHAVDAEIDLGPEGDAFSLAARLYVSLHRRRNDAGLRPLR